MKKGTVQDGLVYHAGFPNAAEDQHGKGLSLDKLVIKHRNSTFFWRLGSAIDELHWPVGTVVVVDRSLPAKPGRLVVAVVEDEFVVCRIKDKNFQTLDGRVISDSAELWGIITYVLQEQP